MIKISGNLSVSYRVGQHGRFALGKLDTPIGTFAIKPNWLDQFEEGLYKGEFVVSRIYMKPVAWRNTLITELCADVMDYSIDELDTGAPVVKGGDELAMPTSDPVDVDNSVSTALPETHSAEKVTPDDSPDENVLPEELLQLFKARESVKLDPTVDRVLLRKQTDLLKRNGYKYDAVARIWNH